MQRVSRGKPFLVGQPQLLAGLAELLDITLRSHRNRAYEPNRSRPIRRWIQGSTAGWLDAVIEDDRSALSSDGDWRFPRDLLGGLHKTLFG